MKVHRMLDPI